jgi:hypothetical protein
VSILFEGALSQWKEIAELLQAIVTTLAIIIGGVWAYWIFFRRREHHLRIEFTVDLSVVGIQDEKYILEVIAHIENKGLVRHKIHNFEFSVRYLNATDDIVNGVNEKNLQVRMPHDIENRGLIPASWGYTFIEPNVRQAYSYITSVPQSANFALVRAKFKYEDREQDFHTAQKLFNLLDLKNARTIGEEK